MNQKILIRKDSGFTLSELVMVMFITGVLVALSIPNFSSYIIKSRLNGAARQIFGDLTAARMSAIKQNCNVMVGFEDHNSYYVIVDKNSNNIHDPDESKIIKKLDENFPGVKNIKPDTKNIFNSKGAMRRMRSIALQNASGDVDIAISIAGRIKIK